MKRHAVGLLAWVRALFGVVLVMGGVVSLVKSEGSVAFNIVVAVVGLTLVVSGIVTLRRVLSEPVAT